jgi:hypothetical protein
MILLNDVKKTLDEDARIVSLFLSELKKEDWISIKIHPEDSRKRMYQLRSLEKVFSEIAKDVYIKRET